MWVRTRIVDGRQLWRRATEFELFRAALSGLPVHLLDAYEEYIMSMTKGKEPTSKSGGMKAHLPASEGNNPTTSRPCDHSFGGKAADHLNQDGGNGNKVIADNQSGV